MRKRLDVSGFPIRRDIRGKIRFHRQQGRPIGTPPLYRGI